MGECMSILNTITSGINNTAGLRIVIAGQEKVGKTTLTCGAPKALLVPLEVGYSAMTVSKVKMLQKFSEVEAFTAEVLHYCQHNQFPFKSIVFDSATALERHIHQAVLESDPSYNAKNPKAVTMESALGGYGKAYQFANEKFENFLKWCDVIAVQFGINIILTCHVFAAKIMDPLNGEFDSWDLLLHSPKNQKTYGKRELITQWADMIGFLHEPMFVTESNNMVRGISAQKGTVLAVNRTPSYVAGNRFGLRGEIPIPAQNGWNHFAQALYDISGLDVYNRENQA
jgi:hypothetical protein